MGQEPFRVAGWIIAVLLLSPGTAQDVFSQSVAQTKQSVRAGRTDEHAGGVVLEIRSYNLKPGVRDHFHQVFVTQALPLLQRSKVDVVAYGPSLHDASSWYLMRAYASLEELQRSEDAFYSSDQWRQGPREAILAAIESYATVVIDVDEVTLKGLREPHHR